MKITKIFTFDSAHHLPKYKGKCNNIHGHTYRLEVTIRGDINHVSGMVMDFSKIDDIVKESVIYVLDHKLLNDIIENPTAENIVLWIYRKLSDKLTRGLLSDIRLWETPTSYVTMEIR